MSRLARLLSLLSLLLCASAAAEERCDNQRDDDGDSMVDCADAECFSAPQCQPDGAPERSNERCSDFVDNDENGVFDCDDRSCSDAPVTVCQGSWDRRVLAAQSGTSQANGASDTAGSGGGDAGSTEEAGGSGLGGEANVFTCSDGLDNDGDGAIDCADLGCQLAQEVTYCRGSPELRFSVVGNLAGSRRWGTLSRQSQPLAFGDGQDDVRFTRLQVRALGPIPAITNSFFLMSLRVEKTPRLTFVTFQVPVARGWSLSLNSGTGTLSYTNIVSTAKQILLDPAFYLTRAFDQGNGGQVQLEGLLAPNMPGLRYLHLRTFSSGGSGRFAGNVGGGYVADERTNFSYNVGSAVQIDHLGYYSVWDTKFLYQQAAQVLSTRLGVKWEQRATERFPALMAGLIFRQGYLHLGAEYYWRQTMQGETVTGTVSEFTSTQHALNAELGILVWPKHLMLAADYGFYEVLDSEALGDYPVDEERQLRAALHWYFWGEIGVASLLYVQREIREVGEDAWTQQNELRLVAQYRF